MRTGHAVRSGRARWPEASRIPWISRVPCTSLLMPVEPRVRCACRMRHAACGMRIARVGFVGRVATGAARIAPVAPVAASRALTHPQSRRVATFPSPRRMLPSSTCRTTGATNGTLPSNVIT